MRDAPFHAGIAEAPEDGRAWWISAEDGTRLRVGAFNRNAQSGTVLLFPGRTEYIEKYGRAAADLAARGYATLTMDWRGQGLADRLTDDEMSGHVLKFADYQQDVAAALDAAETLDLPRPWHLLAHSMGGCIGLRAVIDGLNVTSCAFTGPMWGIRFSDTVRPMAWSLSWGGKQLGLGHFYAPGTASEHYVLTEPFESNKLTNDTEMYQYMIDQLRARPELGIGGPSLNWLHEALRETRDLARQPSPALPCLTHVGTLEDIVDIPRITDRMARWPGSRLEWVEGARHEVLMEDAKTRGAIFDDICRFFYAAGRGVSPAPPADADVQAR